MTETYTYPSSHLASQEISSRQDLWRTIGKVLAGFIPMYLVLQLGLSMLLPRLGSPWHMVIPAVAMLGLALGFEMLFFKRQPLQALRQLGYGFPRGRAVVVALILSGLMLLFFPILSLVTGARLSLNQDWLLTLAGIIVLNGLAEETLFRGYVFGNLRQGSSFLRAGFISLLLFAAVHLYLFIGNPWIIGLVGTLVAVASAFPIAYLFERGNSTIWAPVILHITTASIRLVTIPEGLYMPAAGAWLVLLIFLSLLVFAFHRYLKG
jgi:membrane protease YdiL (CAAX protease family)